MSQFSRVRLTRWRQFENVDIDLSAQTTILTGANGCGKTSILTVLSQHFGWHIHFVSTPYISKKDKKRLFSEFVQFQQPPGKDVVGMVPIDADDESPMIPDDPEDLEVDIDVDTTALQVGEVLYTDGKVCKLNSPNRTSQNAQYQLQYSDMQSIVGMYIPSHRPSSTYHAVAQVPTDPKTNAQLYQEYQQLLLQGFQGPNIRSFRLRYLDTAIKRWWKTRTTVNCSNRSRRYCGRFFLLALASNDLKSECQRSSW
jgi:AAA domain